MHEILKKRGGLEKLNRPKPSTAEFGNWGLIEACARLTAKSDAEAAAAASLGLVGGTFPRGGVTSRVVIGCKTKARKVGAVQA